MVSTMQKIVFMKYFSDIFNIKLGLDANSQGELFALIQYVIKLSVTHTSYNWKGTYRWCFSSGAQVSSSIYSILIMI